MIVVGLFLGLNKKESFSSAGQATKIIPPISQDSDFAKFKQCFCGGNTEQKVETIIPIIPPIQYIPIVKEEICNNQKDDNDNSQIDCAESTCDGKDCGSTSTISAVCSKNKCIKKESACHDNIDNDGDGTKDCDDLDCWESDPKTLDNKCWKLKDNGATKIEQSYFGLSGHYCTENKDCKDGWCVAKHYKLPSLGGFCAPLCNGESCPEAYPGLSTTCKKITNTCPDCIYICTSPYGIN